ncbi:HlyD family efflux transporter periplasmic adaptor subunit [uncultured Fluviicola sp.]|uniref:HlyD family secretion protein n=1 Tax=uncultured Fluviicola sp. TaxID=463303 RepID=UPI002600FDCB|nr:HlyD family efflux transporter periplasmic adaptor subunit [uncultured Fluviicola sp.]
MKRFESYTCIQTVKKLKTPLRWRRLSIYFFGILLIILFLPWTQNIDSPGTVTALSPNNRPQTVHSIIGGRIEKWYVREGQFVKKGDTLVYLSEIKSEYMDPALIERTESAMRSKENSAESYMSKVQSLDKQIDALIDNRALKLQQAQNKVRQTRLKVTSDSMDYKANEKQLEIAIKQYERTEELHRQNLKSLTELENKRLKVQEMEAKVVSLENKLLASRNELINAITEIQSIDADYRDKIAKSESEKSTALSSLYDTEATVTKMQNQISNYSIRSGYYYVTAPQDGYISKALKNGVGETVKEGAELVSIVPNLSDFAVEMFVSPVDLPLVHLGNEVRLQFDGWPAIVFSGWPMVSYGSYGGKVVAIDNFVGTNGKYRVLVAPDKNDHPWPKELRMGVAVKTMTLLDNVPIWYELWRKINGFPPNYYLPAGSETKSKK